MTFWIDDGTEDGFLANCGNCPFAIEAARTGPTTTARSTRRCSPRRRPRLSIPPVNRCGCNPWSWPRCTAITTRWCSGPWISAAVGRRGSGVRAMQLATPPKGTGDCCVWRTAPYDDFAHISGPLPPVRRPDEGQRRRTTMSSLRPFPSVPRPHGSDCRTVGGARQGNGRAGVQRTIRLTTGGITDDDNYRRHATDLLRQVQGEDRQRRRLRRACDHKKRSPRHKGHLHRLRNEAVPHRGVNFNGPGDCGQPADNGRLHTRSLPAASTRRGVAGSTSAEYES